MDRVAVSSSHIKEIGWEQEILEIEFSNGSVYRYFNVPNAEYQTLMEAPSVGKEFHRSIRNLYRSEKV